jgi:COP9 signalosome complex subunit 5
MHARSGGTLEVMGMLLGKIDGENMIVMDSFALPVEGTGKIFINRTFDH